MNFLGIEIGGSKLQLVVGNGAGQIFRRRRFAVQRSASAEGIRARIAAAVPELLAADPVVAVGVGYGGPVDWRTGRICVSHHIAGWSDFPLADWLSQLSGLPVAVDNDANVAALGEALCGAGLRLDPCFYITVGSGVGGGLVTGGTIYHGATPGEAEIGHVRLDRAGATLESVCSGWAMDARIRARAAAEPHAVLAKLAFSYRGAEARCLAAALAQGDVEALALVDEAAQSLAFGLSHVVHLFHPRVIVLGGGLSLIGEPWRAAVAAALPQWLMDAFQPGPAVVLSELGEDAVPVGALRLAAARSGTAT